ncbi:MAG TPA: tetratricopeptide repeat protein, partial [Geobacteraceae bacterium]
MSVFTQHRPEEPDRRAAGSSDGLGWLLPLAAAVVIAALLVREVIDADTWWQVAIGRDILARLAPPTTDHFAAAALGRPYHDSHWLFQVLLALADRLGGMAGVGVAMALLWGGTFVCTYRAARRYLAPEGATLLVLLAAVACSDRFTPRPDVVTCLMLALFTLRLQAGRFVGRADLALLFILQVLWSNAHGLFVIGPFMGGCYFAAAATRRFLRGKGDDTAAPLRLTVLLLAATLVNPYGPGGWRYALLLMTEAGPHAPAFFRSLAELAPTFGRATMALPDFWAFLALLLLTAGSTLPFLARGPLSWPRLLIAVSLGIAAASGRRNMPLFALAAAPLVAEQLGALLPPLRPVAALRVTLALLLGALAWLPVSGNYYRIFGYPLHFGLGASPSFFPASFPDAYRRAGVTGQIYNSNQLGGFCLYHGILPLVDGRWEVYDPQVLERIFQAPFDPAAWEWLTARYDIGGALLMHDSAEARGLVPRLRSDLRWRLVWYDETASLWVRADRGGVLPPPVATTGTALPVMHPRRTEECLFLGTFFRLVGAPESALPYLEQALARGERRTTVLELLGRVQSDLGRLTESEATFRALLAADGRSVTALNELAFLAYARGDREGAQAWLRRALDIRPDDPDVRANYERIN